MENRELNCVICQKTFVSNRDKAFTCGNEKCVDRNNYLRHKERYIKAAVKWKVNNPEREAVIHNKAMKKYVKTDKFRSSMLNNYYNNKDKWASRKQTLRLVKSGVIFLQNKCGHIDNLEIHHEIYPRKKEDIIQAVKDNKIYYLCKKCHNGRWHK